MASRYLRFGTRSTAQVRAYLAARQVPERLIGRLVVECSRAGRLDDRACAKLWATTLAERGYAQAAIRSQLAVKGLDAALIEQVLSTPAARAPDDARARTMAEALLRGRSPRGPQLRRRLARRLASRGFDAELIDRVLADSLGPPDD